jgi:RNA polymerase sigma-70 factor (ECF subfamily)
MKAMPDQDEDLALLQRCLNGEGPAWEEFLSRYRSLIERAVRFTYLRSIYRIPHADVENVVQDLIARLLEGGGRRLRSFEGRCSLGAWLKSLAVRYTLNSIRDEKRRGRYGGGEVEDLALLPSAGEGPLSAPEEREEVRRLDAVLDSLGPLQRTALKMFYYDGLSYRQISLALGIPVQTLGSLITRARDRIREMLQAPKETQG